MVGRGGRDRDVAEQEDPVAFGHRARRLSVNRGPIGPPVDVGVGVLEESSSNSTVELAMPSSLNFGRTFSQGGALAWVPTLYERGSRAHRGRSIVATSESGIIISSRSSGDIGDSSAHRP